MRDFRSAQPFAELVVAIEPQSVTGGISKELHGRSFSLLGRQHSHNLVGTLLPKLFVVGRLRIA